MVRRLLHQHRQMLHNHRRPQLHRHQHLQVGQSVRFRGIRLCTYRTLRLYHFSLDSDDLYAMTKN